MTAKDLFVLVLKILAIYILKDVIVAIPVVFGVIVDIMRNDASAVLITFCISLAPIIIYCLMIYVLLFKTDKIVDKLKLDSKFEKVLELNIHRSTVLSLSVIIAGIVIIIQAIPLLIRQLTMYFQFRSANRGLLNSIEPFDWGFTVCYVAELAIGMLLLNNQQLVVNYIETRRRHPKNINGG